MSTTEPSVDVSYGLGSSDLDNVANQTPRETLAQDYSDSWKWFWLGLYIAVAPLLIPYYLDLWHRPAYQYFPFAIIAVVVLAYMRSDGRFYPPRGWISWATIALALCSVIFAAIIQFPWFAAVGMLMITAALLYTLRGDEDDNLLILILPLATTIQLVRLDTLLVNKLQEITTWMSSVLLDAFAVPHAIRNNVIQLSDRELFVAEACSGIQSVFTMAFLACLMIAWRRRRLWMTPIYLLIACLLAVFANVIRVTVVAIFANSYEADLSQGWPHDLLGYVALVIAAAFLLSFDHLIATLFHHVHEESEFNPLVSTWNWISLRETDESGGRGTQRDAIDLMERDHATSAFQWAQSLVANRKAQITFAVIAGLVCLMSLIPVIMSSKPSNLVDGDESLVFDPPKNLIDDSLAVLTVKNHISNRGYEEPRLGANSDIWECEGENLLVQFVLSQPHNGWHELCNCYERLDWLLLDRDIRQDKDFERLKMTATSPEALRTSYVVARFKRGPAEFAYLMFSGIGSNGSLLEAPDSFSAFTHRVWNRIDTAGVWDQDEVIMLQMWVTSPEKLTPKQLVELEEDFVAARASIADAIAINAGEAVPRQAILLPKKKPTDGSLASQLATANASEEN